MKKRRGFLQIALLHLLKEESMHGYRMMKELEERAGGFYSASAGAVYPALQELLERDWIELEPASDKKTYRITENGGSRLESFANRRDGDFWDEWKERFIWQSSDEAKRLKNAMEGLKDELRNALKLARQNPQKTVELIALIEEMTDVLKRENQ